MIKYTKFRKQNYGEKQLSSANNQTSELEENQNTESLDGKKDDEPVVLAIGKQKPSWQRIVLLILASLSIIIVVLIFTYTIINGFPIITEYGLFKFLFGSSWKPTADEYGILHEAPAARPPGHPATHRADNSAPLIS